MSELTISKSGDFLSAILFDSIKNEYNTFYGDEVLGVLDVLREHKNEIKNVFFSANDLSFNLSGMKVSLSDKNVLKNDKRFDFIFKYIEDKRYKLHKHKWQRISAIALTLVISTVGILSVKAANITPEDDYVSTDSTYVDYSLESAPSIESASSKTDSSSESYQVEEVNNEEDDSLEEYGSVDGTSNYDDVSLDFSDELNVGSMSDSEKLEYVKENYGDVIEKHASTYGLDANLIMAIATQERGKHSTVVDSGGAIGLMQIQVSVWDGHSISAYNYDTGQKETVKITLEKLKDLSFNVQVGCMIFQNYLIEMKNNASAAIQSYNMGTGSVRKIITAYASSIGKTYDDVINDSDDLGWLEYRFSSYAGDPSYLEHVTRYYESGAMKK